MAWKRSGVRIPLAPRKFGRLGARPVPVLIQTPMWYRSVEATLCVRLGSNEPFSPDHRKCSRGGTGVVVRDDHDWSQGSPGDPRGRAPSRRSRGLLGDLGAYPPPSRAGGPPDVEGPAGIAATLRDAPRAARGGLRGIGRDRRRAGVSAAGSSVWCYGRVRGAGAGAIGIGCAVRGRSGRCCTFDRDPPPEDPRNHAGTPRRSTPVKLSHVQSGPLCTWESVNKKMTIYGNRGIVRKTRNRIAESPLSHVQ